MGTIAGSIVGAAADLAVAGSQTAAAISTNNKTNATNYKIAQETNAVNAANVAATNEANVQMNEDTNQANLQIAKDTNAANARIAQMNNEYNEEMLERQIQQEWDMWNAQNEYNSASAQRERLEEAGLNPFLMMSGGSAGSASAMTSPQAHPASPYSAQGATLTPGHVDPAVAQGVTMQRPDLSALAGLRGVAASFLSMMDQQADIDNKVKQGQQIDIENKYRAQKLLMDIAEAKERTRSTAAKRNLDEIAGEFQHDMFAGQLQQIRSQNMLTQMQTAGQAISNLSSMHWYKVLPVQIKQTLVEQTARISLMKSQKHLTDAQVKTEVEKAVETWTRSQLNDQQYGFNEKMNPKLLRKIEADITHAINNSGPEGLQGIPNLLYGGINNLIKLFGN